MLKEHGILLDEFIMSPLDTDMLLIDKFHYVMYRLGKKENGLQIFYRCLRGTQDECPQHRLVADRIESEGIRTMLFAIYWRAGASKPSRTTGTIFVL